MFPQVDSQIVVPSSRNEVSHAERNGYVAPLCSLKPSSEIDFEEWPHALGCGRG